MSTVITLVSSDARLVQLFREAGMTCVAIGKDQLSNLAQQGEHQPELLVIDLRGRQPFPPTVQQLKRQHPATAVLLVTSDLDPAVMLEAMRAGVNECVAEPLTVTQLQEAIRRLQGHIAPQQQGSIFAFVGAKGGVGTTTVAVNTAAALGHRGGSSLLIDLNLSCGDAAVFVGVEPRFSVADALANVHRLDDTYFKGLLVHSKSGFDLLGSAGTPVSGTLEPERVRALLTFATQTHRHIVVDVPRSDAAVLDSLDAATTIVIVANQELATVRSASRMAASLRQRYGRDRVGLVLSRTDRRAEIGHEDVERAVGISVRHTFPSDYRLALQAMNKGRPLVLETNNELASAFTAYARDLGGVTASVEKGAPAKGTTLFGRLAGRK